MKFGTCVKPCRVTGSAPMISMLRSFRMSPMWRSGRDSMPSLYAVANAQPALSPLRLPVLGRCGSGVLCRDEIFRQRLAAGYLAGLRHLDQALVGVFQHVLGAAHLLFIFGF